MNDAVRVHWLGVSLPRSGHHYLVSLLDRLFGGDLRYCEYYDADGCCRTVPCRLVAGARAVFQKNHDFDLTLATDVPGVVYVVQTRDPVMAMLSDREYLAARDGEALAADPEEHAPWLARWIVYYERFRAKWVAPAAEASPNRRIVLDYDALVTHTEEELARLLGASGLAVDSDRIARAVPGSQEESASYPASTRPRRFALRQLAHSRYIDGALLAAAESILLERVPELRSRRRLPALAVEDHPLLAVVRAEEARRDGDHAAWHARLEAALEGFPDNRLLLAARAEALARLGRTRAALHALDEAITRAPSDTRLLRLQSELLVARADESLAQARRVAERLVESRSSDAGARVHLASVLLRCGDQAGAVQQAERGTQLGSRDHRLWRQASEILKNCQSWTAAIAAVRGAIALAPLEAEFHHHLGNLLVLVGQTDEGLAAQRRAIELDPGQPGWRWKLTDDLLRAGNRVAAREEVRRARLAFPEDPMLAEQASRLGVSE